MKKKLLAIVVSAAMALSLVGCMAEELSIGCLINAPHYPVWIFQILRRRMSLE